MKSGTNNFRAVLVTGGAGYIGSHVCKALYRQGIRPIVLDNLSTGDQAFVNWGPLVRADIRDGAAVEAALREHQVDAVMHFAAMAQVEESVKAPLEYYSTNVVGMISLLSAMRAAGVNNIVYSSTCAVYGDPLSSLVSEETSTNPVSPYGRTKLVGEGLLADMARAHGLGFVTLRYFNAAGCSPQMDLGERGAHVNRLIPNAVRYAMGLNPGFTVFGSDFPTKDGTAVRDYVHVEDLADAHVQALRRLQEGLPSEYINLGSGEGMSVTEIVAEVARVIGVTLRPNVASRRAGDPAALVADIGKARRLLGYDPRRSDLETLVSSTHKWLLKEAGLRSEASPQRGAVVG